MHMSVLQEAKVVLFCQSTSRAGAVKYKQQKERQGTQQRNGYPKSFSSCHPSGPNGLKATSWTYHLLPVTGMIGTV